MYPKGGTKMVKPNGLETATIGHVKKLKVALLPSHRALRAVCCWNEAGLAKVDFGVVPEKLECPVEEVLETN